jgi:hypothetical protein
MRELAPREGLSALSSRTKRAVIDGQVTVAGAIVRDPGAIVAAAIDLRRRPRVRSCASWSMPTTTWRSR